MACTVTSRNRGVLILAQSSRGGVNFGSSGKSATEARRHRESIPATPAREAPAGATDNKPRAGLIRAYGTCFHVATPTLHSSVVRLRSPQAGLFSAAPDGADACCDPPCGPQGRDENSPAIHRWESRSKGPSAVGTAENQTSALITTLLADCGSRWWRNKTRRRAACCIPDEGGRTRPPCRFGPARK